MDYYLSSSKQVLIAGYFCYLVFGVGIQETNANFCAVRLEDGVIPCFGHQNSLRNVVVKDANECCVEKRGRVFFTNLVDRRWDCSVCQELLAEHDWLPSPPCDKNDCNHVPQRYLWFALSIPNRRIQCMGRSYKGMYHCRRNNTVCTVPEPTTDPVFCFKHRFRKFNSSSWGCPASSLDLELARDIKECCATRGRAGYAKHINKWYIDEAKLHQCLPCPLNPSSDTTWSQWSTCSSGSKCARNRSMQIPYLENMPNHWCVETFTMEEPAAEKGYAQNKTGKDKDKSCTTILILAIVGLVISVILIGVLCFICIRERLQLRSRSSAATSSQQAVTFVTAGGQTNDEYAVVRNKYTNAPANRPKPRSLPEISEEIYERISFYSTDELTPAANASYMEMK